MLPVGRAGTGISTAVERAVEPLVSLRTNWASAPLERRGEKRRWNPTTEWRSHRKIDRTRSRVPAEQAISGWVATRITVMRMTARVRAIRKNTPPKLPRMSRSRAIGAEIRGMILGGGLVAVLALGALGYFFFDRDGGREVASAPQAASPQSKDVAVAAPPPAQDVARPSPPPQQAAAPAPSAAPVMAAPPAAGASGITTPSTSGTLNPPPSAEKTPAQAQAPASSAPIESVVQPPREKHRATASRERRATASRERRATASRERRAAASRKRRAAASRKRRATASRSPRNRLAKRRQPPRESAAQPPRESAAQPPRESAAQPPRPPESLTDQPASLPADEVAFVQKPRVNIRSEPSQRGRVVGSATKGQQFKVVRRVGTWTQVEGGGATGWIGGRLLGPQSP